MTPDILGGGHPPRGTQKIDAPADPLPGAILRTTPTSNAPRATSAVEGQTTCDTQTLGAFDGYSALRSYAELFADIQEFRKAAANKARWDTVEADTLDAVLAHFEAAEHDAKKALLGAYRQFVPAGIIAWQKEQKGVGEHLLARLLGRIGDPRVAIPLRWTGKGKGNRILVQDGEPYERTVSQLWSFCGHGDPGRTMHKGITAEELMARGNPRTKALVWNIAEACVKAGVRKLDECDDADGYDVKHRYPISRYGDVYLERRARTLNRTHAAECVRCGPSGKPAAVGTPWSKAHQQADALRIVGKKVLRDLWTASRAASS